MVVTLDEILDRAVAAGHGSRDQLRFRFLHGQRIGLFGHAVAKASRRGGEGLWHPAQERLFDLYLTQRRAGVRRDTLLNVPVGLWLAKTPGIELEQAQRALGYWAARMTRPDRPADRRSLRHRGVVSLLDALAPNRRLRGKRRRLRQAVETVLDLAPLRFEDALEELRLAVLAAAAENPRQSSDQTPSSEAWDRLRWRLLGLANVATVVADRADVADGWQWCRHAVGLEPTSPGVTALANAGCPTALELWGVVIEGQAGGRPTSIDVPLPTVDLGHAA